jgi:hypothetical protein
VQALHVHGVAKHATANLRGIHPRIERDWNPDIGVRVVEGIKSTSLFRSLLAATCKAYNSIGKRGIGVYAYVCMYILVQCASEQRHAQHIRSIVRKACTIVSSRQISHVIYSLIFSCGLPFSVDPQTLDIKLMPYVESTAFVNATLTTLKAEMQGKA